MAVGVREMAAFRGRNLLGRLALDVDGSEAVGIPSTGFVFCASCSVMLMLCLFG